MKNNNKSYEKCMFNKINPIFAMYFLHILQGQVSGFHTGAHLVGGGESRWSGPLPFFDTVQILPSNS